MLKNRFIRQVLSSKIRGNSTAVSGAIFNTPVIQRTIAPANLSPLKLTIWNSYTCHKYFAHSPRASVALLTR